MTQTEWTFQLKVDLAQDIASLVIMRAQEYFSFEPSELMTRRLAIHEAVMNALKYGGEAVLTAFGNGEKMQVEIHQKNKIIFPVDLPPFRGTSLIRT